MKQLFKENEIINKADFPQRKLKKKSIRKGDSSRGRSVWPAFECSWGYSGKIKFQLDYN